MAHVTNSYTVHYIIRLLRHKLVLKQHFIDVKVELVITSSKLGVRHLLKDHKIKEI